MTTMTIHADDDFAIAMRAYAAGLGKSVNQHLLIFAAAFAMWSVSVGCMPW